MKLRGYNLSLSSLSAGLIIGVVAAYFTLPTKVITQEAKVVEKVVYRDKTVTKVVSKTTKPDGTTIVVEKDVAADIIKDVDTNISNKLTLKSPQSGPNYGLSIVAGSSLRNVGSLHYGLQVEARIVGPLWISVFGLSDLSGGVGLGFKF